MLKLFTDADAAAKADVDFLPAEDARTWLAIVAAIFFVVTIISGFLKKALTWRGLGLGFLASLLSLVCIMGVSTLLWNGIQALHPEYGYAWNRVHVSDDILYILGFFILALAFATTSVGLVRKKTTILDLVAWWLTRPLVVRACGSYPGPRDQFPGNLGIVCRIAGALAGLDRQVVKRRPELAGCDIPGQCHPGNLPVGAGNLPHRDQFGSL